jgi:hypothetical protein
MLWFSAVIYCYNGESVQDVLEKLKVAGTWSRWLVVTKDGGSAIGGR